MPVMGRSIGGCPLVIDPVRGGPITHCRGNKLAIVADENFEVIPGLILNSPVPELENGGHLLLVPQRKAPNVQ